MKLSLVILSFIFSFNLLADCGYSLNAPVINYAVTDSNSTTSNLLVLTRSNAGGSSCNNFIIGFSDGASSTYYRYAINASTGEKIYYNLYKNSNSTNILKSLSDASSNSEILTGTIFRNSLVELNYYFSLANITSVSQVRGGTYQDTIAIAADSGFLGFNNGVEANQTLSINIIVPKIASLSLVNSGDSYNSSSTNKTLDFGELTQNEEMNFDVIVKSNAGYNLSVSSSNNGVMQLSGAPGTSANQIGYNFYSSGTQKILTTSKTFPVSLSTGAGVSPSQGVRIPIKVVIQGVDQKSAGTYQDYVTFTISTIE